MKLEDRVCTFEQAVKLKECGLYLKSMFVWDRLEGFANKIKINNPPDGWELTELFPAYTVAELGVLIKEFLKDETIVIFPNHKGTFNLARGILYYKEYKTEAQARASALIWLIENKYINLADLKL